MRARERRAGGPQPVRAAPVGRARVSKRAAGARCPVMRTERRIRRRAGQHSRLAVDATDCPIWCALRTPRTLLDLALAGLAADAVLAAAVEVVGVWGEYLEAGVGDVAAVEVRRWRWDAHGGV